MNKMDLVEGMAKRAGITKTQANKALDAFTDLVAKSIRDGQKVTLVGFGTFSVSARKARTGRNPQTGAPIRIRAKKVPKFVAGNKLKGAAARARG